MRIRHLEQIFSIDKVVPIDVLPVFQQILLHCYLSKYIFYGSHQFPCRSLLLSTTILNDNSCMSNCSSSLQLAIYRTGKTLSSWPQHDISSPTVVLIITMIIFQSTLLQLDIISCSYQLYSVIIIVFILLCLAVTCIM